MEDPDVSIANEPIDPCFPYKDGPGHKDATPQELGIMRQMLDTAGINCFQPDFAKSACSKENKWLWNIWL